MGDEQYRTRFLRELERYPLDPKNGKVYELSDIEALDITNPEHLARLIKEGIHLMYQKETASHALNALFTEL